MNTKFLSTNAGHWLDTDLQNSVTEFRICSSLDEKDFIDAFYTQICVYLTN